MGKPFHCCDWLSKFLKQVFWWRKLWVNLNIYIYSRFQKTLQFERLFFSIKKSAAGTYNREKFPVGKNNYSFVSPSHNNKEGIPPLMWNVNAQSITFLWEKKWNIYLIHFFKNNVFKNLWTYFWVDNLYLHCVTSSFNMYLTCPAFVAFREFCITTSFVRM